MGSVRGTSRSLADASAAPQASARHGAGGAGSGHEAAYLSDVVAALWPPRDADHDRPSSGGASAGRSYAVAPTGARPRMLVPLSDARVAATAVRPPSSAETRRAGLVRALAQATVRTVGPPVIPGPRVRVPSSDADILHTVRDRTGLPVADLAVLLGSPKPNRKPLAWLLDERGRSLGFVKLGWNPLTRRLVDNEAAWLRRLGAGDLRTVRPPRLIDTIRHGAMTGAVLEPLAIPPRARPASELLIDAVREIAAVGPLERTTLSESRYLRDLRARIGGLVPSPEAAALQTAIGRIVLDDAGTEVVTGLWHGDFRPWNVSAARGRLLVWDWERFGDRAPLGLDAVHFWHPLQRDGETLARFRVRLDRAWTTQQQALDHLGVARPRLLHRLHLVEMATRLLDGLRDTPDPTAAQRARQLLDVLNG